MPLAWQKLTSECIFSQFGHCNWNKYFSQEIYTDWWEVNLHSTILQLLYRHQAKLKYHWLEGPNLWFAHIILPLPLPESDPLLFPPLLSLLLLLPMSLMYSANMKPLPDMAEFEAPDPGPRIQCKAWQWEVYGARLGAWENVYFATKSKLRQKCSNCIRKIFKNEKK